MNTLHTLFKDMKNPSPRETLRNEIFSVIESLREAQLRRQRRRAYIGLSLSGIGVVYALFAYGGAFVGSEFWSVVSLFFSDVLVVANYWNEFSLLLLETIPVVPILLLLLPTFAFLLFLNMYFKTREMHRFSY